MIRVAFASTNDTHVNTHFGAAERFVIFDVAPGRAERVGVGEFQTAVMKGANKDKALPAGTMIVPGDESRGTAADLEKPPEDKVIAKLAFLSGCAAVYAASIGNSSIKRLMAANIQPIIVGHDHDIVELLNEVSLALVTGGLSWVSQAVARAGGTSSAAPAGTAAPLAHALMTSLDDEDADPATPHTT